jgi:hypothetical protein
MNASEKRASIRVRESVFSRKYIAPQRKLPPFNVNLWPFATIQNEVKIIRAAYLPNIHSALLINWGKCGSAEERKNIQPLTNLFICLHSLSLDPDKLHWFPWHLPTIWTTEGGEEDLLVCSTIRSSLKFNERNFKGKPSSGCSRLLGVCIFGT